MERSRTHQYARGQKHEIHEEVSRLREAGRLILELTAVGVQEVRIKYHAELRSCQQERCDESPDLRQAAPCEDLVRKEEDVIRINEPHPGGY